MTLLPETSCDPDASAESVPVASRRLAPPVRPRAMSLHVSKLRGITNQVRQKLKRQGIVYTHQLIEAALDPRGCRRLAARSGIDEPALARLARRADLARIHGVGATFADMLERLGVDGALPLARQEPAALHRALARLNAQEQLARRAPTPHEVQSWIGQAAALVHDAPVSDSS